MTTYNDELYWVISGTDLLESDILALLGQPILPYPSSAFFYAVESQNQKSHFKESDLEHVANSLLGVAVRAFDTRSFLIWWREDLRPFPSC